MHQEPETLVKTIHNIKFTIEKAIQKNQNLMKSLVKLQSLCRGVRVRNQIKVRARPNIKAKATPNEEENNEITPQKDQTTEGKPPVQTLQPQAYSNDKIVTIKFNYISFIERKRIPNSLLRISPTR